MLRVAGLVMLLDGVALAGSGRVVVDATPVHVQQVALGAGMPHTIEVIAEGGARPVVHLQALDGSPLAGTLDGSLELAAPATALDAWLVVRAETPEGAGTGVLRIDGGAPVAIAFGGALVPLGALPAGARVDTVEVPGGPDAAAVLVLGDDPARAAAYADDGAIGRMGGVTLAAACAGCTAVVGAAGAVAVIADAREADTDADGLGDALESALATDPTEGDTDADGLGDGAEVLGVPGHDPQRLPRWGADPRQPDLFVEATWLPCDPVVEWCGPEGSLDRHQLAPHVARALAAYFAPDVAVHLDNGLPPAPGEETLHGAWGGARREDPAEPCNADSLGVRFGLFHRMVTSPLGSGGHADYAFCSAGDAVRAGVLAQELGHNFGLQHGGSLESFPVNCKPHYRSPMNYAYTYDPDIVRFSRGEMAGIALDPTALDERAGLGTTAPALLADLAQVWDLGVREDGAIDWNRDGRFEGVVRFSPAWGYASCEQAMPHGQFLAEELDPALAWLPVGGTNRLYLITRDKQDGGLLARSLTRTDLCEYAQIAAACTDFTAVQGVPGSRPGHGAPTAATVEVDGSARLVVVYAGDDGRLRFQLHDGEAWTEAALVDPSARPLDPTLVASSSGVALLAPVEGVVTRWDWTGAGFSGRTELAWDDGTPLEASAGVGATVGWSQDQERLFLAVPAVPDGRLELAIGEPGEATFARHADEAWPSPRPQASGRPALVYAPYDVAEPREGRLFLAWRPWPVGAALISLTEGTDPDLQAPSRRLRFRRTGFFTNVWGIAAGAIAVAVDPATGGLRAAWGLDVASLIQFFPFADGVFPAQLRDQDDYARIRGHLACSLTGSCP